MRFLKFSLIAAALAILKFATAEEPYMFAPVGQMVFYSCTYLIGSTALLTEETFTDDDFYYGAYCDPQNPVTLGTLAHCLIDGFSTHAREREKGLDYTLKYCKPLNLTREELEFAYDNATDYLVDSSELASDPNFNMTELYYSPIKWNVTTIQQVYDTFYSFDMNFTWSTVFSIVLVSYWFIVIGIAGICNLLYFVAPNLINSKFNGDISKSFRKHISLPATFRKSHANFVSLKYFLWILPTRLESLLIFGWFILVLAFNIAHINHVSPNYFWPDNEVAEISREVADRSGIIAVYLIPVNILFAGRNNILLFVSGWSQSRLLTFHRWTSRIMFVCVILHSVGMAVSAAAQQLYAETNSETYVIWGYVGTISGAILCIHSFLRFRSTNYELFLLGHIVFAAIFIVGGWIHVRDLGYEIWYITATCVWGFDRLLRLARLAVFGLQTAVVELKADEMFKVTVPRPKYWKPFPGCHAYIHFIRPTCFWQSHPFTLVDYKLDDGTDVIIMYIKVKGGVTHGFHRFLSLQPGQTAMVKVLVEGPYGERIPIDRFQNSVFVAGGNGIPGLYSEAIDLSRRYSNTTKRIRFYWVIRNWRTLQWFADELKQFEGTKVETIIYVTKPEIEIFYEEVDKKRGKVGDFLQSSLISPADSIKSDLAFVEFREGRPIIEDIVKLEMKDLQGTKCFISCAHPLMVDEMRHFISESLDMSEDRVDYFEQIQVW